MIAHGAFGLVELTRLELVTPPARKGCAGGAAKGCCADRGGLSLTAADRRLLWMAMRSGT